MASADSGDLKSGPQKRTAPPGAAGDGDRKRSRPRVSTYLQRLTGLRKTEPFDDVPVQELGDNFLATVVYWIKRTETPLMNLVSASRQEKQEHAKESLHVLQRLYCVLQKLNVDFKGSESNLPISLKQGEDMVALSSFDARRQLHSKIATAKRVIQGFGKSTFENPCDLGIDKFYNEQFKENVWDVIKEESSGEIHAGDNVAGMDVAKACEAAMYFLDWPEPRKDRSTDSESSKRKKLDSVLTAWARLLCLHQSLEGKDPAGFPELVKKWKGGVRDFEYARSEKLRLLEERIKKFCDDLRISNNREALIKLLRSTEERDVAYRRVMKKRFEEKFWSGGGRPLFAEPNAKRAVAHLDEPINMKEALEFFVDRDESKYKFDDDNAQREAYLRDWKRVLALKENIGGCDKVTQKELVEPSDELRGEETILKQADKKIKELAEKVKNLAGTFPSVEQQVKHDMDLTKGRDTEFDGVFMKSYSKLLNIPIPQSLVELYSVSV